jgi:N-acyl-D-amino-acid deacylase
MWGRPLDFEPGTRYAYSNFGYCVLGRVIESIVGTSYERFVRRSVLSAVGATRMRLGASLEAGRCSGEARYYTRDGAMGESVFGDDPRRVPWPYGGFCLEAMDSHGGWIASACDLVRFASLFDEGQDGIGPRFFRPKTLQEMFGVPPAPVGHRPDGTVTDVYYGCGWMVRRLGREGRMNQWHNGSLPGTYALLVRRWDGLAWAVLFNQRSELPELPDAAIDPELHRAVDASGFQTAR